MAKRGARVSVSPSGFVTRTHLRCPDCEYRGALRNEGKPIIAHGYLLTWGCETCGGRGELPLGKLDPERIDPYVRKRS